MSSVSERADQQRELRSVLGAFASGVTVVTVGGVEPHGMTANAFTSVSLDPPLVLVCVHRNARMHEAIERAGSFAVSVLAQQQVKLARYFSARDRLPGVAQFADVPWSPGSHSGAPLLTGALAWLECALWSVYAGGDHSIFVGQLLTAIRSGAGGPLVFHDGRFCHCAGEVLDGIE